MPGFDPECGPKCRSRKHAEEFNAAISKCTLREIKAFSRSCYNAAQYADSCGRTALHVAAAIGKTDIVEWLLKEKNGDVTAKDNESGWTALHRALFYGQLAAGRLLVQNNSDLYTRDHEGLGPLDLIMKDQPSRISFSQSDPSEIFTWGDNSNFTLGHSTENRRCGPEPVDELRKLSISIRQIVMSKYHTVFLSSEGQVYTCGHGQGGRLCHGDEATCLVPKLVETIRNEKCKQVAAARDHTVMLMEGNIVYSCGLNDCHQLGQFPAPDKSLVPKQVYAKVFKGKSILGVCAGRFHTVIYTSDAVFSFGINAGQLGHPKIKADWKISQPRQVSALNLKGVLIVSVCCSNAATVCLTGQGDIFVLHEYQCRKIASKWHEIKDIQVSGGHLDHTDSEILSEKEGSELVIGLLSSTGKVFIWRSTNQTLRRAHWAIRRQLFVSDFKLTDTKLAIITDKGEAFLGLLSNKKNSLYKDSQHSSKEHDHDEFGKITLMDLLLRDEVEDVQVVRITSVNRGTYITADSKGQNFAVLQSLPNCSLTDVPMVCHSEMISNFRVLLEESDEFDNIHDVIIQCKGHSWPAHRFILQSRSTYFNNLFQKDAYNPNEVANVSLSSVHPQIFEQVLIYMYTDSCELLNIGSKFELREIEESEAEEIFHMDLDDSTTNIHMLDLNNGGRKLSAFEVHQKRKILNKDCQKRTVKHNTNFKNPVIMLQEVAKRFGIEGLSKKADCVRYSNGFIVSTGKQLQQPRLKFDKQRFRDSKLDVYDVSIQSSDGIIFTCHKCVLVARLEYFHSMLASGWMETSASTALTLPMPGEILEILLDYLYTDEAPVVTSCGNAELLCNMLVVADQMLVGRLKELCEVALANLITIKNAAELLEFSCVYNASQLKATCQQFICLNLSTILEARALDVLSDEVLSDLTKYYRHSIPCMSSRIITPYNVGPDKAFLESLADQDENQSLAGISELSIPKKPKTKKKRQKSRSVCEEGEKTSIFICSKTEHQVSISSDVSFKSDEDLTELMDSLSTSPILDITMENLNTNAVIIPKEEKVTPIKPCIGQTPKGAYISPTQAWSPKSPVFSMSPQTPKGSLYMESPTGTISFKDIMEEEEQHVYHEMKGTGSEKRVKFSWKDIKKHQQKEQKQQQQQKQEQVQDIRKNASSQQLLNQSAKSNCPWGSKNQVVQSFRNLMTEDQQILATSPAKNNTPADLSSLQSLTAGACSWGLPSTKVLVPKIDAKKSDQKSNTMARSPENPWQKNNHMAQSPPPISASNFSEIVNDEMELRDVLNKARKKPFGLIQMEELAIQELRVLYKASQNFDEYITVERVPQIVATPLWMDERKKPK